VAGRPVPEDTSTEDRVTAQSDGSESGAPGVRARSIPRQVMGQPENRMSNGRRDAASPNQPVPAVAKAFAAFSFLLALIGVITFWPPKSPAVVAWILVWGAICLATGIAILRRMRYAPALVWTLLAVAGVSALDALRSGLLGGIGMLIDIVLFVPLVSFAVWYQRNQRSFRTSTEKR
jgi:uncharacterized membrane protein